MWNARALLKLHAGNFWALSYHANQFCKLSRTWLKCYWFLRKRQYMRDKTHRRPAEVSLFPLLLLLPWETPDSREWRLQCRPRLVMGWVGGAAVYQVMCIRAEWLISSKLHSVSVRLFPFPPGQDVKHKLRRLSKTWKNYHHSCIR